MACNCGKSRPPLGSRTPPPPPPPPTPPSSGTTQSFALIAPDGATRRFGSRLEADAARVRARQGVVRPE